MDILLNPNIAYLILAFGLMITVMAILSPGTGVLEIAALLVLGVVGWEVYNLSFNWWALVSLLLGMGLFIVAIRRPKQSFYLILSIIALVFGSAYLFPSDVWWIPAVNPLLALLVSALLSGFFWIVTHKILEARSAPPHMSMDIVIGETGEAKTDIQDEGTVQIGSELWSATSPVRIPRGEHVKVTGRNGFVLDVVPIDNPTTQEVNS